MHFIPLYLIIYSADLDDYALLRDNSVLLLKAALAFIAARGLTQPLIEDL